MKMKKMIVHLKIHYARDNIDILTLTLQEKKVRLPQELIPDMHHVFKTVKDAERFLSTVTNAVYTSFRRFFEKEKEDCTLKELDEKVEYSNEEYRER